jgi:hypothetical protein
MGEPQRRSVELWVVCHCGERFSIDELRKAQDHITAEHPGMDLASATAPGVTWPQQQG